MGSLLDILNPISGAVDSVTGVIGTGMNYAAQTQNLDYMKSMQKEAWSREDNAIQRRVRDLKEAGLSPVLAAGSAAQASSPIQVTAPQMQMPSLQDKLQKVMEVMRGKTEIEKSAAETALALASKAKMQIDTLKSVQDTEVSRLDAQRKVTENDILGRQLQWDITHRVRPGTGSGTVKDIMDAVSAIFNGKTPWAAVEGVLDQFRQPGAALDAVKGAITPKGASAHDLVKDYYDKFSKKYGIDTSKSGSRNKVR